MTAIDPRQILDRLISAERDMRPPVGAREASWALLQPRVATAATVPTAVTTTKLLAATLGLGLTAAVAIATLGSPPVPSDIPKRPVPQDTLPQIIQPDPQTAPSPPVPATSRPVPEDSSWSAELTALQQIHAALREDRPADALALVDEHTRRWPTGEFREEIDAARALALCAQGPRTAAHRALSSFRRRWPASLYTARVRQRCTP